MPTPAGHVKPNGWVMPARKDEKPKGRRWVKARQCAAIWRKPNSGYQGARCGLPAQEGRLYCWRHGTQKGVGMLQHLDKVHAGQRRWFARMRALDKQYPGLMREVMKIDQREETRRRVKEIRAKGNMPKIVTADKMLQKADKELVKAVAELPRIPDKPFEELEPHEQLVRITGESLTRIHEIVRTPIPDLNVRNLDPMALKLAAMIKDASLRALTVRIKADGNALAARKVDRLAEILERLKAGDQAKVIEGEAVTVG